MVNDVAPDGPAAQAGIRANDVIISVNDKPAVSALETMDQVAEIRPGSKFRWLSCAMTKITLAYRRSGISGDQPTRQQTGAAARFFYRTLLLFIDEIFARGDIFLQRIEHAFQRLLLKGAEFLLSNDRRSSMPFFQQ